MPSFGHLDKTAHLFDHLTPPTPNSGHLRNLLPRIFSYAPKIRPRWYITFRYHKIQGPDFGPGNRRGGIFEVHPLKENRVTIFRRDRAGAFGAASRSRRHRRRAALAAQDGVLPTTNPRCVQKDGCGTRVWAARRCPQRPRCPRTESFRDRGWHAGHRRTPCHC